MRRLIAVLLAGLAMAGGGSAPASASGGLGVGNPGQGSFYALIKQGTGLNVTVFEGSGPASGPSLRVDLSGLAASISVTAEGQNCVRSGGAIDCDLLYRLRIDADAGTGPGQVGRITVRDTESSASITVDVLTDAKSKVVGSSITVNASIGDVVAVPLSVRNEGPNTLYRGGIVAFSFQENAELVSIDGCKPGPQECSRDYFRPGTSIDITLRLRITGCPHPRSYGGYGWFSNPGATWFPGQFRVKVAGCAGTTTGTQGGSSGGSTQSERSAAASKTVPTALPSGEQSAQPSEVATASPKTLTPAAASQKPSGSWWPPTLAAMVVLALGLGTLTLRMKMRRSPQDEDSAAP